MGIRSAAKAIVVHQGRVLLNRSEGAQQAHGPYYELPGGGQRQYETLHECLVREVLEETGYTVELGPLLAEDHLTWPARPDRAPIRAQRFLFAATITGDELGTLEEEGTTDFARWVPMAALADQPLADIVMLALRALGR